MFDFEEVQCLLNSDKIFFYFFEWLEIYITDKSNIFIIIFEW